MLTRIMKPREDREAGFTLIELLVVVAIIAILAVIAIPLFNNLRDNAANTAAESDVRNAVTTIEVTYTQDGRFPTDVAAAVPTDQAGADLAINIAPDTALLYTSADGTEFTLQGCNTSVPDAAVYIWDSTTGSFDADTDPATNGATISCDPADAGWQ